MILLIKSKRLWFWKWRKLKIKELYLNKVKELMNY